ncbi:MULTISPECIES: hypothetical protein [unclassified Bartonella]|uniref:hypothetical protein n=1 Tax=unclassified Bartonella TaxID=2645622 RepID=UPI0035CEF4E6
MCKKYELTSEIKKIKHALTRNIINLYRIRALKDFDDIKAGALGGFIEKEVNLSHDGNCWVYDEACVYGHAHVYEDATVFSYTRIYGRAKVCGSACIYSHAKVYNYAFINGPAKIYGEVYGNAKLNKRSKVRLVPQNCEFYESDNVVKIVDETE